MGAGLQEEAGLIERSSIDITLVFNRKTVMLVQKLSKKIRTHDENLRKWNC